MRPRNYHWYYMLFILFSMCFQANAQLRGTHLLGDAGLQSGSQAPPSFTPLVALYDYRTSTIINADGEKKSVGDINAFLIGFGGSIVPNVEILGGNYSASLLLAFASNKIEGDVINTKSSLAFSDTYIQPLQLGWKQKRADFNVGYAMYIPTGKYELGSVNNSGLGIFTNELSAGTTIYLDNKKEWNFSALLSYAFNSSKKNTGDNDVKVGNVLSCEGGVGKTWYKKVEGASLPMIINAGIVYYIQYKITEDKMQLPVISSTTFNLDKKDHIFGLGIESNVFIPKIKSSLGIRWLVELGARNRTQGNSFFITMAPCIKFLQLK